MADIFDRCGSFIADQRLASPEDLPVARRVLFDPSPIANAGPYFEMNGRRMLQFSTNDYLGMSRHPEVMAVAAEYALKYGIGAPMGARPLSGTCGLHLEFERQIAEYKRTESAIAFTMGAGAMMGSVACLARPGDLLILDQFAHASLVAGSKIAGATVRTFRHNDLEGLERILVQADPEVPKLIIVDGVYSMNADIAPLVEICDLKEHYGARLFVDDAHGNGVCGKHGRGVAEVLDVEDRIDIHAGTFSKAFGTSGGFIAASEAIVFYIRCLAPTLLFTKAPSAVVTAATMKSMEIVQKADDRRERAWGNARYLQGQLRDRGFDIGNTCTPITPIHFRGNGALHVADILRREFDLYVSPVVYPAVRRNAAIIRVVPTAMHTREDCDYLVSSLVTAKEKYEAARDGAPYVVEEDDEE